jgi:hypothetical protein
LRAAGIQPDEVITDDARLYPSALAEICPTAVHQLCLFHATRRVVRALNDVVKQIRRSIPTPPPAILPRLLGRFRQTPPEADQHDADSERLALLSVTWSAALSGVVFPDTEPPLKERTGHTKFTSDGPSQQFVERLALFAGKVLGLVEEERAVEA